MTFANPPPAGPNQTLDDLPSTPPPPGVTPNFVNPLNTLKDGFIALTVICLFFNTTFVALRVYTKLSLFREFLVEDYSLVFAWLLSLVWFGINVASPFNGRHFWDVSVTQGITYSQSILNVTIILFAPISFFAKHSIFTQLRRLFAKERNAIWWHLQISTWINLVVYVVLFFLAVFQCVPRSKIGNPFASGTCIPFGFILGPPTVVIILTDIWIMLLPLIIIWKVRLALQRKFVLGVLFFVGAAAVASAILELYFFVRTTMNHDLTYHAFIAEYAAGVQLTTLILAGALPTMPDLVLSWRNISMQEDEPSSFGRLPSRAGFRGNEEDFPDPESGNSLSTLKRSDTPIDIVATTDIRVTSIKLNSRGLED